MKAQDAQLESFIKESVVNAYKKAHVDRYLQVHKNDLQPSRFGERANEVVKYCSEVNKNLLRFNTYGSRFGNYIAFEVLDSDLKARCSEALRTSPHYILVNQNQWQ